VAVWGSLHRFVAHPGDSDRTGDETWGTERVGNGRRFRSVSEESDLQALHAQFEGLCARLAELADRHGVPTTAESDDEHMLQLMADFGSYNERWRDFIEGHKAAGETTGSN
jgi:hypothetical protein